LFVIGRNAQDKPAQEKATEKTAPSVAPKRLNRYEKKNTDSNGVSTVAIVVSLIVILCLLIIAWFVVKRYKKKKSKKNKKNDNTKTDTTDDADLPNNSIDPFERIDAVCALPPPYEQIEKENVYVNYNPDMKNISSQKAEEHYNENRQYFKNKPELLRNQAKSKTKNKQRHENKIFSSPSIKEEPVYRSHQLPYEYGSSNFTEIDERFVYPPSRPRTINKKSRGDRIQGLDLKPYKEINQKDKNIDVVVRPSLRKSRNSRTRSSNISWNLKK